MLARRAAEVEVERSTEQPLTVAETKRLLASVDTVLLLRGPSLQQLDARAVTPDQLRGPTGKIRAPLVRVGRTLLAGFRPEALERLLAGDGESAPQRSTPGAEPGASPRAPNRKA